MARAAGNNSDVLQPKVHAESHNGNSQAWEGSLELFHRCKIWMIPVFVEARPRIPQSGSGLGIAQHCGKQRVTTLSHAGVTDVAGRFGEREGR